jgi:hypothetical protein
MRQLPPDFHGNSTGLAMSADPDSLFGILSVEKSSCWAVVDVRVGSYCAQTLEIRSIGSSPRPEKPIHGDIV